MDDDLWDDGDARLARMQQAAEAPLEIERNTKLLLKEAERSQDYLGTIAFESTKLRESLDGIPMQTRLNEIASHLEWIKWTLIGIAALLLSIKFS